MENRFVYSLVAIFTVLALPARAENVETVTLYQVGTNGRYCISLSPTDKSCVSGVDKNGDTVNIMNFVKGKKVVFQNVSDAPHDMKFSGANAEELPPQMPKGDAAEKQLAAEDPSKQNITCSFHGKMLSVGYKVIPRMDQMKGDGADGGGHKDPITGVGGPQLGAEGRPNIPGATGGPAMVGRVVTTGLADVAKEVLSKGRAADVANLVSARPELMTDLQQLRPVLAKEIATGVIGNYKGPIPAGMLAQNKGFTNDPNIFGAKAAVPADPGAQLLGGMPTGAKFFPTGGGAGGGVATLGDKLGALAVEEEEAIDMTDAEAAQLATLDPASRKQWLAQRAQQRGHQKRGLASAPATAGSAKLAALGAGSERTRLKIVNDTLLAENAEARPFNWHLLIIMILAVATFFLARSVFGATKKKRA